MAAESNAVASNQGGQDVYPDVFVVMSANPASQSPLSHCGSCQRLGSGLNLRTVGAEPMAHDEAAGKWNLRIWQGLCLLLL